MNTYKIYYARALFAFFSLLLSATCLSLEDKKKGFFFEGLIMPGPLFKGHEKFEKDCAQCHGENKIKLCQDCHDKIDADIKSNEGFHGRLSDTPIVNCYSCHTEHLGRDADIINLDKDTFNHDKTDFQLEYKHATSQCSACHKNDQLYRDAPQNCYACHEADDSHKGAMGETCDDCHSSKNWTQTEFNHDETEFALLGKHQETTCNACHPDQKYENTPTGCYSCHAIDDVHNRVNGKQCDQCHQETKWDDLTFNHDKDTDFKLQYGHANLNCKACHSKPDHKDELSLECVSCHKNDDKHFGRNGDTCDSCHSVKTWAKTLFDHNIDTDFELHGQHTRISCESCHGAEAKDKQLNKTCIDCHKNDDAHKGQEGTLCQQCHNPESWIDSVRFDHNLTEFPLVGLHAITQCNACHISKEFRFIKQQCIDCHKSSDVHKGGLGTECAFCHTPNDWKLWIFDHDKQTEYPLDGAHKNLSCESCHKAPTVGKVKQNPACIACHAKDDEHNRRFGRSCERCHNTEAFNDLRGLAQ